MKYIDEHEITNKRVLLRIDANVSLNPNFTIADDQRIKQIIPTIEYLLKRQNKIILVSHLGRPQGREEKYSLRTIAKDLQTHLPSQKITLIPDFLTESKDTFTQQPETEILLLENIRFYQPEEENDVAFAKQLASLADVYVNDAFSVSHRKAASIVAITNYLPSYAGLLMKKEITNIHKVVTHPEKPFVAILGGSKVSTKIHLLKKLCEMTDTILLGGGLANTFLAIDNPIGKSLIEKDAIQTAKDLLNHAQRHSTNIVLPLDVVVSEEKTHHTSQTKRVTDVSESEMILDLGPATLAHYGRYIAIANTIIWNGPVGYFENSSFKEGTDFIYYSITENTAAFSVVGGGETLAAIAKKEYLEKISHISTGGGAMLEYIEKGTLPGIVALQ